MTDPSLARPPQIVIMGVSGAGKSAVGSRLASSLGVDFIDGDDLHSAENVKKMTSGIPLTGSDRRPWLAEIGITLRRQEETGAVIACSALRRLYRDIIRWEAPHAVFVHLVGPPDLIAERMAPRKGHYMPATLLRSQFDELESLENDEAGFALSSEDSLDTVVANAVHGLGFEHGRTGPSPAESAFGHVRRAI